MTANVRDWRGVVRTRDGGDVVLQKIEKSKETEQQRDVQLEYVKDEFGRDIAVPNNLSKGKERKKKKTAKRKDKKTKNTAFYGTPPPADPFRPEMRSSGGSIGPILSGNKDDDYDYEKANFEIHEDAEGNVFVKDLSIVTVTSREEVRNDAFLSNYIDSLHLLQVDAIIQSGLRLRATYETKMNAVSSRSHTVFTLHIFQHLKDTEEIIYGMLNMVDLAGSERLKKSESDGQRLKEALHINSSLSAVGKVVMSLDPESGYSYIPYRDSKLTRLLQNSIGGNSITMLIATIHPMREHYEECLSTLQFANRCRSVQNQPRVNHINSSIVDKDRRIRKLNEEITSLRRKIDQMRTESSSRLLKALHVLGFDAQEVTEAGEIKFAVRIVFCELQCQVLLTETLQDGSVLHSVFDDIERGNADNQNVKSKVLLSNTRRVNSIMPGFHHNGFVAVLLHVQHLYHITLVPSDLAKRSQEHLQEKYVNAKNNFSALITETTKEKEKLGKTVSMQRSRIKDLECVIEQKQKEFRYALMHERATSQKEMAQIVANNQQLLKQSSQNKHVVYDSHRNDTKGIDYSVQLTEQIARIEASKQSQMALLQEQVISAS
ncbi:unnamed protein product [Albugo candida]|uniref:Kinesin-like protein n=2 Tax=Albugo candida TaxID=65357 RepID=A0A024GH04_9STRA|nr:unnamed protein product [Albugo candida]|eukprot:CCI46172.1 unnamed protein product [Albugo candida]